MRVRLLRPPPLPSSHLCMYYSKSSFAQKTHNVHRNGTSPPKRRVDRSRRSFLSGRLFILKRHWQTEKKFTTNSTAAAADFLGFLSSTSLSNKDVIIYEMMFSLFHNDDDSEHATHSHFTTHKRMEHLLLSERAFSRHSLLFSRQSKTSLNFSAHAHLPSLFFGVISPHLV